MTRIDAWAELGISPTNDPRAIKRAYAANLKAFDPDDDPRRFLRLRSAREIALGAAPESVPESTAPTPFEPMPSEIQAAPRELAHVPSPEAAPVSAPATRTGPTQSDTRPDQLSTSRRAIAALLWDNEVWSEAMAQELLDLTRKLLSLPDIQNLTDFEETEAWLAQIIVETEPRADGIIDLVANAFGWQGQGQDNRSERDLPDFAIDVLQRRHDLAFRKSLDDPNDHLHAAFQLMKSPRSEPIKDEDLRSSGVDVCSLLNSIHLWYPTLKREIDDSHYQLWIARLSPRFLSADGVIEFEPSDFKGEVGSERRGCASEMLAVAGFAMFMMAVLVGYALLAGPEQ